MLWYEVAGSVLYYITLPIVKLLLFLVHVLRVGISPFIYIATTIVEICLVPYNIASRFEAVWYFIGCAILIGAVTGLILHGIFRTFVLIFQLDRKPVPTPTPAKGHDVKSYRKARDRKKQQNEKEQQEIDVKARALANSPLLKDALTQMQRDSPEEYASPSGRRKQRQPSLLDQTIVERSSEEDS